MAEETKTESGGSEQLKLPVAGATGEPVKGSSQQTGGDGAADELRARLRELESEAAGLRQERSERQRKDEESAALARGEHEKVIADLKKQNETLAERLTSFDQKAAERLEASIKTLPENVQKEIGIIREALPHEKLEEYVAVKAAEFTSKDGGDSNGKGRPLPSPSATTGAKRRDVDNLDEGTRELLDKLMAPETVYETGRLVGHFPINEKGDHKFRFMATGDDDEDCRRWIRFVQTTAADPFRTRREEQLKRVKSLRDVVR